MGYNYTAARRRTRRSLPPHLSIDDIGLSMLDKIWSWSLNEEVDEYRYIQFLISRSPWKNNREIFDSISDAFGWSELDYQNLSSFEICAMMEALGAWDNLL